MDQITYLYMRCKNTWFDVLMIHSENELMKMMKELSVYQKERIETMMIDFVQLNNFCEAKKPTVCPTFDKSHKRFIKKGFAHRE